MPERGFLVISDITGYTQFLTESELEHAQDILRELLKSLIEHTRAPLIISKLEGDAVFSYAAESSFTSGQTLVSAIEETYKEFRMALRRMRLNTTCTCTACSNIPNLDLKFFVHHGEYVVQDLGMFTELLGTDVNLVHRMMKNSVTEKHGLKAYAMYSEAAIDALELPVLKAVLTRHQETYDHIGDVTAFLQDMHIVWQNAAHERRIVIEPDDALIHLTHELPYPRELVWEVFTRPDFRNAIFGAASQEIEYPMGELMGAGAVYHCYHGEGQTDHTIVDWQPFEYYTFRREELGPNPAVSGIIDSTFRFTPLTTERTGISWMAGRVSDADGKPRPDLDENTRNAFKDWDGLRVAESILQAMVESGDVTLKTSPVLDDDQINAAIESVVANMTGASQSDQ